MKDRLQELRDGSYFRGMLDSLRWTGQSPFAVGDRVVRSYGYSTDIGIVRGLINRGMAFPQVVVEWPTPTRRKKFLVTQVMAQRLLPVSQLHLALARVAQLQRLEADLTRAQEDLHWQAYADSLRGGRD